MLLGSREVKRPGSVNEWRDLFPLRYRGCGQKVGIALNPILAGANITAPAPPTWLFWLMFHYWMGGEGDSGVCLLGVPKSDKISTSVARSVNILIVG